MKVYIVRRGWDDPDCSPQIKKVFADREAAVAFVETDIQEDLEEQTERGLWEVRLQEMGPCRWSLEILFDNGDYWVQDEVWLLEEHEVL